MSIAVCLFLAGRRVIEDAPRVRRDDDDRRPYTKRAALRIRFNVSFVSLYLLSIMWQQRFTFLSVALHGTLRTFVEIINFNEIPITNYCNQIQLK